MTRHCCLNSCFDLIRLYLLWLALTLSLLRSCREGWTISNILTTTIFYAGKSQESINQYLLYQAIFDFCLTCLTSCVRYESKNKWRPYVWVIFNVVIVRYKFKKNIWNNTELCSLSFFVIFFVILSKVYNNLKHVI